MNTIYNVKAKPYVLDPFPLEKQYLFPRDKQVTKNNTLTFSSNNPFSKISNKEMKQKTEKFKQLISQIENQKTKGNQLNTLI